MKKLLAGMFIFGFLFFIGARQVHASILSDVLLQIKNLKNEMIQLQSKLKASVLDSSISTTPTSDLTPRISYYSGKVNQHVDIASGTWQTDSDGSSGAGIDKLTYCKKFYPNTTSVVDYKTETINSWHDGGNANNYTSTRMSYKCVEQQAPVPVTPVVGIPNLVGSVPQQSALSSGVYAGTPPAPLAGYVYNNGSIATSGTFSSHIEVSNASNGAGTISSLTAKSTTRSLSSGALGEPINSYYTFPSAGNYSMRTCADFYDYNAVINNGGAIAESSETDNCSGWSNFTVLPSPTAVTTPSITVLSPNGGETYTVGQPITIKWKTENVSADTRIIPVFHYVDSNDIGEIHNSGAYTTGDVPNTGSTVIIPKSDYTTVSGKHYQIRLVVYPPNTFPTIEDSSDNLFSIVQAPVPVPLVKSPCSPYGDVDNDGYLSEKDINLMTQKIAGTQGLTYDQHTRADVNKDGVVTVMDITLMKNVISGASNTFPVCTSTPSITVYSPDEGTTLKKGIDLNSGDYLDYRISVYNTLSKGEISLYITEKNDTTWSSGKNKYIFAGGGYDPKVSTGSGIGIEEYGKVQINSTFEEGSYYLLAIWKGNDGKTVQKFSDKNFKITNSTTTPSITITSPNGGGNIQGR